jgi:hypothetical protein
MYLKRRKEMLRDMIYENGTKHRCEECQEDFKLFRLAYRKNWFFEDVETVRFCPFCGRSPEWSGETMTEDDLKQIEKHLEEAYATVNDLCLGRKDWTMSIPVDKERDPDIIIGDALYDLRRLIDFVRESGLTLAASDHERRVS